VAGDGDSQIDEAVKAELLLAEARWRRGDQRLRHDALNQRLGTLFALNFAVLAILGGRRFDSVSRHYPDTWSSLATRRCSC